jgi:hypothetical protein
MATTKYIVWPKMEIPIKKIQKKESGIQHAHIQEMKVTIK